MKTIAADLYTCINLSNLIVKPSLFLYLQFIKVMPAVTQIAHTAIRMQFIQQIQINIRNQNHFGIRSLPSVGKAKSHGVNTPDWAY